MAISTLSGVISSTLTLIITPATKSHDPLNINPHSTQWCLPKGPVRYSRAHTPGTSGVCDVFGGDSGIKTVSKFFAYEGVTRAL